MKKAVRQFTLRVPIKYYILVKAILHNNQITKDSLESMLLKIV
jgi:hypothetical protein